LVVNYYNEIDSKAAVWLQELINERLIPEGKIDTRSIRDVQPGDLDGFTRCHFFAGIGGWSLALRLAGWPEDRPVWTGSCPCQPFSCAGKGEGASDDRNLWNPFMRLIRERKPEHVFGEQVAAAIGSHWLDRVSTDLEAEAYSVGSVVLGAHSIGAPHIRQRLYWVANSPRGRINESTENLRETESLRRSDNGGLANAKGCTGEMAERSKWGGVSEFGGRSGEIGLADAELRRSEQCDQEERGVQLTDANGADFWSDSIWWRCRDGKSRRIPSQSLLLGMVNGVPASLDELRAEDGFPICKKGEIQGRLAILKGYGNAIVPPLAAVFISTVMESIS
jgi:DNA (cytosine-5)-methyltransferase 1